MPRSKRAEQAQIPEPPYRVVSLTRDEKVELILQAIEEGTTVTAACLAAGLNRRALYEWRDESEANASRYARARDLQADAIADLAIRAAEPSPADTITDPVTGRVRPHGEWMASRRLHHDALKWYAAKVAPKRWGDRVDVDVTSGGKPLDEILRRGRERVAKLRGDDAGE